MIQANPCSEEGTAGASIQFYLDSLIVAENKLERAPREDNS